MIRLLVLLSSSRHRNKFSRPISVSRVLMTFQGYILEQYIVDQLNVDTSLHLCSLPYFRSFNIAMSLSDRIDRIICLQIQITVIINIIDFQSACMSDTCVLSACLLCLLTWIYVGNGLCIFFQTITLLLSVLAYSVIIRFKSAIIKWLWQIFKQPD